MNLSEIQVPVLIDNLLEGPAHLVPAGDPSDGYAGPCNAGSPPTDSGSYFDQCPNVRQRGRHFYSSKLSISNRELLPAQYPIPARACIVPISVDSEGINMVCIYFLNSTAKGDECKGPPPRAAEQQNGGVGVVE